MKKRLWLLASLVVWSPMCAGANDGKAVYTQTCAACHALGLAGAPKLADKAAWAPRVGAGKDALMVSVLRGKGGMPPKGGNASISDVDARAAVEYILSQVK